MSEKKVGPTFHFLTKIKIKMTHLVFELYYDKTAQLYQDPLSTLRAATVQQFSINEKCKV